MEYEMKPSVSVIFLDLDGVLTVDSTNYKSFHPDCVQALKKILDETNALIVLTSCWRKGFLDWSVSPCVLIERPHVLAVLGRLFEDAGLPSQRLVEVTPITVEGHRGTEISKWLDKHSRVKNFIILDDDSDMEPHKDRLVQTHEPKGLTMADAEMAIKMLTSGIESATV